VEVDDELMNLNPEIPSLFVQPFVENAIKHGLMHKKEGNKQLSVAYRLTEHQIVITVQDNGIGRSEAEMINQANRGTGYQSYATKAIKDRLSALNALEDRVVSVMTEDLEEGTRVSIRLALK